MQLSKRATAAAPPSDDVAAPQDDSNKKQRPLACSTLAALLLALCCALLIIDGRQRRLDGAALEARFAAVAGDHAELEARCSAAAGERAALEARLAASEAAAAARSPAAAAAPAARRDDREDADEDEGPPRITTAAVMCCFDGPAWMQRRYGAVLVNALGVLPETVAVQVYHKTDESFDRALEINPSVATLRRRHPRRLVFTAFPDALKKTKKRADLVLSLFFWERAVADRILFFGTGGGFCGNSPHAFDDFAPLRYVNGDNLMLVRRGDALREVRAAIDAQDDSLSPLFVAGQHGPTGWLHHRLSRAGVADAPPDVKRTFAAGADHDAAAGVPFAVTGTLSRVADAEARKALIELCPEVKLIFPSLSEPGCFGAKRALDRDRCVNSLCVVSPEASGCR